MLKNKFSKDLLWSLLAFVFLGITGIILNFIIGRYYGPETLGGFNQVFALYIVVSQFAVFGLRFSALKYIAEYSNDSEKLNIVTSSVLYLVLSTSSFFTLAGFLAQNIITTLFESPAVGFGWACALPGLWAFSINKVLLAILNGHRDMKGYACFQIFRYSLILINLIVFVAMQMEGKALPLLLSIPEFILLCALSIYTKRYFHFVPFIKIREWIKNHFLFGLRSMLSGTIAELNTKVDVLMLGYFCTDTKVGLYSMAAMIAEGVTQLSVVLRDNLNPLLTKHATRGEFEQLTELIRKSRNKFYLFLTLAFLFSAICYPSVISFITGGDQFAESWYVYLILATGISMCSGYLPVNMVLVQMGKPGQHTFYKFIIVATNIFFNYLLVPQYGIYGAAMGTALSFVLSPFPLKFLVKKNFGLSI